MFCERILLRNFTIIIFQFLFIEETHFVLITYKGDRFTFNSKLTGWFRVNFTLRSSVRAEHIYYLVDFTSNTTVNFPPGYKS